MFRIGGINDLSDPGAKRRIRRWRCGRIVFRDGQLVEVQHRLTAGSVSVAQVWWQLKYGKLDDRDAWIDYHQPIGMPTFLTLDYLRIGRRAGHRSLIGVNAALAEIARIRGALAIVTHVTNGRISDRALRWLGWERHATDWDGRHWIRRFYDGYPSPRRGVPIA